MRRAATLNLLAAVLGLGGITLVVALLRAPYGKELILETGEVRDLYWEPSRTDSARPSFVVEPAGAPGLEFIRQEALPALARSRNDLQRATAIRKWVRQEIEYGSSRTDPKSQNLAADEILREGRRGVKSPCNRLAALMVTACVATGLPARMVHLSTEEGAGHFVAEVWLPDQGRWMMMDPSLNYYAVLDGAPASTLDIHRAVKEGRTPQLLIERDGATTRPDPYATPFNKIHRTFDYFRSFAIVNRNDFLTHRTKLAAYTLLVWKEGSGPAHPAASERLRLVVMASTALALAVGAAAVLARGGGARRPRIGSATSPASLNRVL